MSSVSYKWKKKDRKRNRKPYDRPYNEQPWYLKYKLESYLPNWVVNVKNYFLTNVAAESDENNINEENGGFGGSLLDSRPARMLGDEGENDENEEVEDEEEEEEEAEEEEEEEEDAEEEEEDAEDVEEEESEDKLDVPDTEEEEVVVEEPPKAPVKETSKYDFKVTLNKMDNSNNLGKSGLPGSSKISTATAQRFSGKRKLELGPITTPTPSTSRGIANEVRDEEGSSSSENTASSTSGCSSLVASSNYLQKLSLPLDKDQTERLRKELLKNTRDVAVETDNKSSINNRDESRRSLLWSHSPSSRFNVSKFTSPTSVIPRGINSPYYEGKTSFGGTSAKRARLAAPLNKLISPTNNATNVKIQLNSRSSDNGKKLNSEDLLSDAAKRILANIEKISSPLEDAKKIPVYGSIDTSRYLSEPRRTSIRTPYARPVKSVPYPSLKPSLVPIEKPQLKWAVSPSDTDSIDRVDSSTSPQRDLASTSPAYGGFTSRDRNSGGGGGGKIRAKLRKNSGDSQKLYEKIQSPELPNVPFNITNLPAFSFAKASAVSTPVAASSSTLKPEDSSNLHKDKDIVETPESRVKPTTTIEVIENESEKENKLHTSDFSIPVPLKEQPATTDTTSKLANASVIKADISVSSNKVVQDDMVVPKSDLTKENTSVSQVINSRSKISADAALAAVEGNISADDNQEIKIVESSKINSSETSDQSSKPLVKVTSSPVAVADKSVDKTNVGKTSESLFSKFKPPPGSWMCEECFVQNKPADLKCIACETVKKGAMVPPASDKSVSGMFAFGSETPLSKPSFGDIVLEKPSINFQFPKPPEDTPSEDKVLSPSQLSNSNTSNCSMSVEVLDDNEEVKKTTTTTMSSEFSFDLPKSNLSTAPSVTSALTASTTPSTFAFGSTPAPATTSTTEFTFGQTSKVATSGSSSSSSSSGFVFGSSANKAPSSVVTPTIQSNSFSFTPKPPTTTTTTMSSGFSFDIPKSSTSTAPSITSAPTSTSTFAFGSTPAPATTSTTEFTFGQTSKVATSGSSSSSSSSGFVFGSSANNAPSSLVTPSIQTKSFSFSPKPPTTTTTMSSGFSFDMSKSNTSTAPSATSTSTSSTTPSSFAFGSTPAPATTSTGKFSFGQTSTASTSSSSGFVFGSSSNNTPSSLVTPSIQSNSFSFTPKPPTTTTTTMSSGFSFDLAKSNTSTAPSVTSAPTSSTSSTFAFGSTPASATTSTGGFNFGQTSAAAPSSSKAFVFGSPPNNAPSSLVTPNIQSNSFGSTFAFGASSPAPQSQAPAPAAGSSNVFTFGSSASTNHTQASLGATPTVPAINFETQPNFNFLNQTQTQGPFRFAAEASTNNVVAQRNFKKAKRRLPRP